METTVTLDWDPPQGSGPEAIVDNYIISISPDPPYKPAMNVVPSPPWNITLIHNTEYNLDISATNCLGRSGTAALSISFSECKL